MQCKTLLFGFLIFLLSLSILCFLVPKLSADAADWTNVETWTANLSGSGSWHTVERWTFSGRASPSWRIVEKWTLSFQASASWQDIEYWTFNFYVHTEAWYDAEIWTLAFDDFSGWFDTETWNVTGETTDLVFHEIETWNITGTALKQIFSWDPLTKFYLSGLGTYIGFDNYVYFDSFTWDPSDCTYITFTNIYMDEGVPIPSLTVSMIGGNVSFDTLSYLDMVSFTFYGDTGSYAVLYLTGLYTTPYNVTIDGEAYPTGTKWGWDGVMLTVGYSMPSPTSRVVLSWAEITTVWNGVETWNIEYSPPGVIVSGVTWYYRSNTITTNSITGYELSASIDNTLSSASQNLGVSSDPVQFGFLAYMVNSRNVSISLTGDVPTAIITRSTIGEAMDSATVTISERALTLGMNTINVKLYIRLGTSTWLLSAEYTTQRLMYTRLVAASWQFNLYTKTALDPSNNVVATAYWGDSTHQSGISGLSFQTPTAQETAIFYAGHGDWIHAILYPYMIYAGDAVYGLGFLFVGGVLYLRHKKWEVILVCLFLFGGAGGLGFLIPDIAYRLLYIVTALALTWLLIKVFK